MKIPVYASDFESKNFDKILKLVSKVIEPEKISLGKAREILSKALGYHDHHDLHKSIIQSAAAPSSQKYSLEDIRENAIKSLSAEHGRNFSSAIEHLGLIRLSAFSSPQHDLLSPLNPALGKVISKIVSSGLYHNVAQQLNLSSRKQTLPDHLDIFTSSISSFFSSKSNSLDTIKEIVVREAHDLLCKHDGRGWLAWEIYNLSKGLGIPEKILVGIFNSNDFGKRSLPLFESIFNEHVNDVLINAYVENHKSRTLRVSGADWSNGLWFPQEFKEWNYIQADVFGEDYFDGDNEDEESVESLDDDDDFEDLEDDPYAKHYIHQKYEIENAGVVEIYACPVEDSIDAGISFHNWVARLIHNDVIICQATGTCYDISLGCSGGSLIYTSDMDSDTDVYNSEEFLTRLRDQALEANDRTPQRAIRLEELGDLLIFFQGMQKNNNSNHYYAGANFAPLVVEILEEAFISEDAYSVLRTMPDSVINHKFVIPEAQERIDFISRKVSMKLESAFMKSHNKKFMTIIGGEKVYGQFEALAKVYLE